jgi:hypothetical protein
MNMNNKKHLSKYLLSIPLMSFLTLGGFLQGNLMADDKMDADSSSANSKFFQDEEGSSVQVEADGTKIIKRNDGTIVQVKPDGTKFIRSADGSTIQVGPDGTKIITKPDGSTIQIKPPAQ